MKKVVLQALVIAAIASWAGMLAAQFRPLQTKVRAADPLPVTDRPGNGGAGDPSVAPASDGAAPVERRVVWPPPPGTTEIDLATAKLAWDEGRAQFIDARSRQEFKRARVLGAWSVPQSGFHDGSVFTEDFVLMVAPDTPLIVYCEGGDCDTSHNVATRLQSDLGFQAIYILKPGIPAWALADHPMEGEDVEGFRVEVEQYED